MHTYTQRTQRTEKKKQHNHAQNVENSRSARLIKILDLFANELTGIDKVKFQCTRFIVCVKYGNKSYWSYTLLLLFPCTDGTSVAAVAAFTAYCRQSDDMLHYCFDHFDGTKSQNGAKELCSNPILNWKNEIMHYLIGISKNHCIYSSTLKMSAVKASSSSCRHHQQSTAVIIGATAGSVQFGWVQRLTKNDSEVKSHNSKRSRKRRSSKRHTASPHCNKPPSVAFNRNRQWKWERSARDANKLNEEDGLFAYVYFLYWIFSAAEDWISFIIYVLYVSSAVISRGSICAECTLWNFECRANMEWERDTLLRRKHMKNSTSVCKFHKKKCTSSLFV